MADVLTYEAWQKFHGSLFGMCTAQHAQMMVNIAATLKESGFTPEELYAASRWLATNNPPSYPNEHLPRLLPRLHEVRRMGQLSKVEANARQRATQEREKALRGKEVKRMLAEARKKGVIPCR